MNDHRKNNSERISAPATPQFTQPGDMRTLHTTLMGLSMATANKPEATRSMCGSIDGVVFAFVGVATVTKDWMGLWGINIQETRPGPERACFKIHGTHFDPDATTPVGKLHTRSPSQPASDFRITLPGPRGQPLWEEN